jgi:Cu+-exporting ATPase
MNHQHTHHSPDGGANEGSPKVTDPVCGMKIDPAKAAGTARHRGRAFHFCSKSCLAKFEAEPDRYLPKPKSLAMATSAEPERSLDPVCGMMVDPKTAAGSTEYEGRTIYFCCQGCLKKFVADPRRYLVPCGGVTVGRAPPLRRPKGPCTSARWTPRCARIIPRPARSAGWLLSRRPSRLWPRRPNTSAPCIPKWSSDHPGSCPKCGMALEPRTVTGRRTGTPNWST